jgi:hypothetical protein
LRDLTTPNLHKLNRFLVRVGRIHIGHRELTGASLDYQKAGLALIEQGISDTLCSLDQDLISWDILDQVEGFFHYLDQHIIDDIRFWIYDADAVPDEIVDLPASLLDFLDDLLLAADAQAHRFERSTGCCA